MSIEIRLGRGPERSCHDCAAEYSRERDMGLVPLGHSATAAIDFALDNFPPALACLCPLLLPLQLSTSHSYTLPLRPGNRDHV